MTNVHARISDLNHPTNHRGQCRRDKQRPVEPQVLRPFHRSEAKAKRPNDRHRYAYDALLDGETIVANSRDPEHDLAVHCSPEASRAWPRGAMARLESRGHG